MEDARFTGEVYLLSLTEERELKGAGQRHDEAQCISPRHVLIRATLFLLHCLRLCDKRRRRLSGQKTFESFGMSENKGDQRSIAGRHCEHFMEAAAPYVGAFMGQSNLFHIFLLSMQGKRQAC